MSVLVHCDGPTCEESADPEVVDTYVGGWNGRYVGGWLTLLAGDLRFNFHHLDCLNAWATHPERMKA